jgi:hypothetical protein
MTLTTDGRQVALSSLRELYAVPPNVTFQDGLLCPIDICHAPLRRNETGWTCTDCPARWDVRGEHGQWSTGQWSDADLLALALAVGVVPGEPRIVKIDPVVQPRLVLGALAVLAGPGAAAYATADEVAGGVADAVPDEALYAASVVVLVLAVLVVVYDLIQRRRGRTQ